MSEEQEEGKWIIRTSCVECGLTREPKDYRRHREHCSRYQEIRYDKDLLNIHNPWQEGYTQ